MEPGVFADLETARYVGYHFDGKMFWVLPLLVVLSCAAHALRRTFGRPAPPAGEEPSAVPAHEEMPRSEDRAEGFGKKVVLRHTRTQRWYHWVNTIAIFVLLMTGLGAILPAEILGSAPPATRFVWHRWFAVILMVGVPFHITYDAFVRNSFGFMWFGKGEVDTLVQVARNFLGQSSVYPKYHKYHPMQIVSHWLMAGSLLALIATGLILWKPTRVLFPLKLFGLGWDFVFFCRILHGFFTSALLALLIGHVYFAVAVKQNWIISKTMLTGRIDYDEYTKHHTIAYEASVEEGAAARQMRP